MSDLISKQALLEKLGNLSVRNITDNNMLEVVEGIFDIVKDAINSAPAVSGEAVACYVSKTAFEVLDTSYSGINHKGISKEQLLPDDIALYLAPPQPQPVKDALEKAASALVNAEFLLRKYCSDHHWIASFERDKEEIRKLIEDK